MLNRIKSFIKNKVRFIKAHFSKQKTVQKMSVQKRRLKKNGYVAILLAFATPAIIYGVKYAIDKSIFSSWNIFKKQNNEVYKKCATAIAYEVASHWNPVLTLEQQIDSLQKIADETYNTYPEYHGGILGRAIAGLERIDIFDLKSLKVTQRTSMNSKFRYIKYKNADVSYYPYTLTINNNANPYFALYRFVDSVTNEITDSTNKNHKRPLVAMWAYERKNRLPRNILSEADIFIGPASFPKMSDKDKNNKYGPYSSLSNEGAFVFTNALPDDSNFKNSRYSTSESQAYFLSENNFDIKFATTKNNFSKIGISSISKGSAISDKLMIPDTVSSDNPKVTITLEGKDKIKIEADATDSSDPSKKYKDKDTAYATPAKCKVDIILSIPTNEAACNTGNLDAASITSGSIQTSQVDANKNTADAKLTPIYQIAQAYRTFLKENFFFVQGVNVGLIPYSGKVSLPPNRENWTTSFNAFYSNAFIDDISKFPRKCKPSFRMSILYGTSGLAGAKLYGSTAAADKQLSTASYTWGTTLTGFPIMFRMGLQSLERDTTKQDLLGNKISYGGNYIYTGSILSSENPEKSATKRSYTATMNEPAEPPSALANKFLKMNMNPCYGGYANLLGMKCEQDSPFFLPNPYYIIELTPNVQRIYEILGSLYPFYDTKNVSNFTFIPITWANNLLAEWTDGSTDIAGDTKRISQEKKTSSGRKKVLIFVVNKPDYFEPGELTYLGFNNDYAEFSGVESDKIDFTIPYNSSLYYGDDKQYTGTITGYKRILRFTGTAAKGNFYFPEKALLKVIVESTIQGTSANTIVTCNGIQHQIIGRKTIYVESNTITKKSGNEWYVAISCGTCVKLISGELTNAIQPPRLEWKSGTNIIHSYNGKVPFTMTVQAPEATIKFSPYSSAGANEYSGTYKIPYGKEQTFKFKSKQTNPDSPVGNKQIYNKFSYTLNNTSMSYTISNRKIRWKGGSSGWYDEGLTVLPTANTYTGNDYLNIRMTGIKKYRTEDYWALVQKENVITDKHGWWIFSYYDKCKSYYYYVYEKKSTQADYQEYQPGKITFILPELFTGNAAINHTNNTELKYNFDNSSTKAPGGAGTNIDLKTSDANTNSINLSSNRSVNIYQYDEFYSADPKPPELPSKPDNPTTTIRSRLAWWEYLLILPIIIPAVIYYIYINDRLLKAIIRAVQQPVASVESAKKEAPFKTGDKIYYAIFSENEPKQYENITTNGIVNFYGTADIDVNVKTLPNKTPSFSLTKRDKSEEKFDFDINNWTPKEESGEDIYIRNVYVQSKDYDFDQQGEGANLFDVTVDLENGAKIVSIEPDYDNVDKMVAENNVPKPRIEWNGGNIIKTIGGQTPIKITVSPKEECQITLSSPDGTTVKNDNFTTYSIAYGEKKDISELIKADSIAYGEKKDISGLIKADNITMEANGSSYEGAKINKFSYILKNTTMTCDVANRRIRWKGGKNEWSDEGVSILDSECIQKEALPVAEGKKTDAHSHLIFTKREDNEDGSYNHVRGRIVWRFPEKITGTASVCWILNKPFFPTEDQRTTEEKINELTKRVGNENDNKNIEINNDGSIKGEVLSNTDKNGNIIVTSTPVIDSLYGSVNLAKKYIEFFEKNIKTLENQLSNLRSPVTDAMEKIRSAFTNLYKELKSVNKAQLALSKAQSLSQDTKNEQKAPSEANNILDTENDDETKDTLYGQLEAAKADDAFNYIKNDILEEDEHSELYNWFIKHKTSDKYVYEDHIILKFLNKSWTYDEVRSFLNKHDIATAKKSILEIIDALKEKYQELAAAELKLNSALDELKHIEKDLIKTKLGYYENVMVLGKDDKNNQTTTNVMVLGKDDKDNTITTSERKYFDYKIPNESDYNNKEVFTLDDGKYINSDSNGDLSYFTISTDDTATTNYKKITTDDSIEEGEYWNIHKDASGTIIPGIENIIPTDTYITSKITLSDKDMLAIFQSKRYLNGQKFYYMEFIQDDSKPLKIPCDVSAPNPELKKPAKPENDAIITEYNGTNVYTKESKNIETMTNNLSIIDPDNQITRTDTTDIKSNVTTSSISGTVGFCGTGDISVTATGAPKPYAYIKKLEGVGGVTEKFEFEKYHEIDEYGKPFKIYEVDSKGNITIATDENGNVKYKVAEKAIYIDPYTYEYKLIDAATKTYQIKIELSNAVINTVEIMSDELAHPELSAHTRMVDGATGTVPWSGGSDDTKHLDNLKIEGNAYQKLTNSATLVNTKDRAGTKMYVLNYPGDANLLIEDTGTFIGSDNTNIGKQTFIGGMINYETYAPGAIRKFFPFWRDSKYNNYITTSSTSASTNLTMCEFSYPMNAILLFGQQSLSLEDGSFYKYKWQDPATAKTDSRDVYDQANALKYVVRDACTKLKDDYGGDSNVRIYVIKYRAQKQYYSVPYYGNNQKTFNHDYSEIENCASPSTFLGMHLGGRYIYNADSEANLKKALNEIAEDIKEFAKYEDAKCVD